MAIDKGYLGNPLLKGVAHTIQWTPEMVEEFRKCKESPEYFARTYIQIVHVDRGMINFIPYDYQEQIIKTVHENRFTILCCSRQSGKCLIYNTLLQLKHKKTAEIYKLSIGDLYQLTNSEVKVYIDDIKFISSKNIKDYQIETEEGFVDILQIHKTVQFEVYEILLDNGLELLCADTHILIDENYNEIFVINSLHKNIRTKSGIAKVISAKSLNYFDNMYDLSINSNNSTYYSNDILSHNTTAISANILHYIIFNSEKTVALLANKGDTAREILSRIKLAYENLPNWLQQGVLKFNEGSIELENNSRVIATSTSSSAIRGYSCVTDDTWVCIEENGSIYYTQINKLIKNMPTNEKKYTVYKTVNKTNNKIYIGFHSVPIEENVKIKSDFGSIFNDGYLGSGKLIKRAIQKYAPEGFYQELLGEFTTKEEAEKFEKLLVTPEFTLMDISYNVNIGGNVRISYGDNNGFYGKTHSDELKKNVSDRFTGNKSYSNKHNCKIKDNETGEVYLDFIEFKKTYPQYTKKTIIWEIGIGRFSYDDEFRQKNAMDIYNEMVNNIEIQRKVCGDRFRGTKRKDESKKLAGISIKSYIETHPEEHQEKMLKINKNPDKIAKTAEKHRGMKRSDKAKKNMSDAQLGKLRYKNKQTKEVIYLWDYEEVPDGFVLDKK